MLTLNFGMGLLEFDSANEILLHCIFPALVWLYFRIQLHNSSTISAVFSLIFFISTFVFGSLNLYFSGLSERSILQNSIGILLLLHYVANRGIANLTSCSTDWTNRNEAAPKVANYWRSICKLSTLFWPKNNPRLQAYLFGCFGLMVIGRILGIMVPLFGKKVVDNLTDVSDNPNKVKFAKSFKWEPIALLSLASLAYKLVDICHAFCWIRVEHNCALTVNVSFFEHLHYLSHRWHLEKKPSDVLKIPEVGAEGLNSLIEHIFFSMLPTIADILIAAVYLSHTFNPWVGFVIIAQVLAYLFSTTTIMKWRRKLKERVFEADQKRKQKGMDSLLNFETVKYFANETYETEQYSQTWINLLAEQKALGFSGQLLDLAQAVVINIGIFVGSLLSAWMVHSGSLSPGDYFLFIMHANNIQAHLRYFGNYFRKMQECLVGIKGMLKIFEEEPEIKDNPPFFEITNVREIEFRDVSFSYIQPGCWCLRNISFIIPPGETIALVGSSGSGKSTILKLLLRLYDPTSGDIFIDGTNIRRINQKSLRRLFGIVAQDVLLFNNTIRYNVTYGKPDASDGELNDAIRMADLSENISSFPDGLETMVRERGMALSGGEKVRVSIARAILKPSSAILLDEPTTALDSITEQRVQESLVKLCDAKTTIIIAHKLSSIVNAHQILVLESGRIVERGTHSELQRVGGLYTQLWNEQQK